MNDTRINLRVSYELKSKLIALSAKERRSLNAMVLKILEEYLQK